MKNDTVNCKNYFLPFIVRILDAIIFAISANSSNNHCSSFAFPFFVSLNNAIHTFDSFADFKA